MAKFRKRSEVVEAEQWWPGETIAGVRYEREWVQEDADGERISREGAYVVTARGQRVCLLPGDWVITEPDGTHCCPCGNAVFQGMYEAVPEESET